MKIQDRNASIVKGGEVKKVYNDVASPENKTVHRGLDRRHAMLVSMYPMLTPRAERTIDHLMTLTEEEFAVLCHHEGTMVVLDHSKLDLISDAIDHTKGNVKPVEYDDVVEVTDEDVEDEALVAALLAG